MEQFILKLIMMMLLVSFVVPICLDYGDREGELCDQNQRLVDGRCYDTVQRCIQYSQQQQCILCEGNIAPDGNGQCPDQPHSRVLQTIKLESNITLYTLAYGSSQLSRSTNYLDPLECKNDPLFARCDNFLRNGEYGHFISKTSIPWQSISIQLRGTLKIFRIIYLGAGGGVMLCVIQIDSHSYAIILQSLVAIAATQLVNDCLDYSVDRKCVRCRPNYHLQQNSCIADIAGCVSYFGNICLQCRDWGLLVQNRCIYECYEVCDTRHMSYLSKEIRY